MEVTPRIQNIISDFQEKLQTVEQNYYANKGFIDMFLYPSRDSIEKQIQDIDTALQELKEVDTEEYHNLMNKREELLLQQESFSEEIQREEAKYNLSLEEVNKRIKEEQEKIKCEFIKTLTDELQDIETQMTDKTISTESQMNQEAWEDLKNAKALCEIYLKELKEKDESIEISEENQNSENLSQQEEQKKSEDSSDYTIIDDMNNTSTTFHLEGDYIEDSDFKIIDDMEEFSKEPKEIQESKIPYSQKNSLEPLSYEIIDDMANATIPKRSQNRNVEDSDFEIIDDMEQSYQDGENNPNKEIQIHIEEKNGIIHYSDNEGNSIELSISSINGKNKTTGRANVNKICKELTGNAIKATYLSSKIHPAIIEILNRTKNNKIIWDYIESIYEKKPLPFNLQHSLIGLTSIEKWIKQKFTRPEEKSGAQIVGKLWDKDNLLSEHSQQTTRFNNIPEQAKPSAAKPVIEQESIQTQTSQEVRTAFIPRADGKNKEIAEKFKNDGQPKRSIEELINALDVSLGSKMEIAGYVNRFGEAEARERYKKQFAEAEAKLSMKEFVEETRRKKLDSLIHPPKGMDK